MLSHRLVMQITVCGQAVADTEQIFRHADCIVVTVGPGSYKDSLVEKTEAIRPFLFATDFGAASLHALPHAISFSNYFGAKLRAPRSPCRPHPGGFFIGPPRVISCKCERKPEWLVKDSSTN